MILVMYSGGLDSLGVLYKLLTEEEYKNYKIHVHHIHIFNIENRTFVETIAVKNTLNWLKDNNYRSFEYSESSIKIPVFNNCFFYDPNITRFFAGSICLCLPEIKKVAIGVNKTDQSPSWEEKATRAKNIFKVQAPTVDIIYPVGNMSKLEIYNILPVQLRELVWSCRWPRYYNKTFSPCGKCEPCLLYKEYNINHKTFIIKGNINETT